MNVKKGYNIHKCLELKKSPLHGLGVFATEFIPKGTRIEVGHYFVWKNKKWKNLRTPYIAFVNYDENPNSVLRLNLEKSEFGIHNVHITNKDIQIGEEITLKYSWYDPTKPNSETNKHYIPLPNCVSIEQRDGKYVLYALEDIQKDFNFGMCHHWYTSSGYFEPNPIGGYLTESITPNSVFIKHEDHLTLKSKSIIRKGEKITVNSNEVF